MARPLWLVLGAGPFGPLGPVPWAQIEIHAVSRWSPFRIQIESRAGSRLGFMQDTKVPKSKMVSKWTQNGPLGVKLGPNESETIHGHF